MAEAINELRQCNSAITATAAGSLIRSQHIVPNYAPLFSTGLGDISLDKIHGVSSTPSQ